MKERIVNYRHGTLFSMKPGDTIYIKKMEAGYDFHYFCEFIEFKKSIVKAKIIDWTRSERCREIGQTITARLDKCYLYGTDGSLTWNHCIWFDKKGNGERYV